MKESCIEMEMDRCTTDAVGFVTGAKLGRRSLKFIDNGGHGCYLCQPGNRQSVSYIVH